jgi:hypothetical protein
MFLCIVSAYKIVLELYQKQYHSTKPNYGFHVFLICYKVKIFSIEVALQ